MLGLIFIIKISLTCDVERDESIENVLPYLLKIYQEYGIVGTWFIEHDLGQNYTKYCGHVDEQFPKIVEQLNEVGEIGTHVHFREINGAFNANFEFQENLIGNATDSLRNKGFEIQSFRGGDHFINNDTIRILKDLNYIIDSSIMQGFSRRINENFIIDHRIRKERININEPYFISSSNYLIPGDSHLLEIPVTNLILFRSKPTIFIPFPIPGNNKIGPVSNISYLLTKIFGLIRTDLPLVILFHDFTFKGKRSLNYFHHFIDQCSNDDSIKFVTLKEIKKEIQS